MTDDEINAAIAAHLGITRKHSIPDFSGDLNEMHEAEKTIYNHNNLWTAYYYQIGAGPFSLHVTARKKAEAFLRIHGKWEEVQK
jgi:hypothetical protein